MAVKFNHRREFDILDTEMGVFNCSADPEIYGIFASSKKQPSSITVLKCRFMSIKWNLFVWFIV
jgi:hypothetical protein